MKHLGLVPEDLNDVAQYFDKENLALLYKIWFPCYLFSQ